MLSRLYLRTPAVFPARPCNLPHLGKRLFVRPVIRQYSAKPFFMAEFKLKDLSSLDLKNGDKVEAEVDGIEGGKVLLVKLDDKVHALNHRCTHYGAPLKNGALSPEGRLTCPWHGGQSGEYHWRILSELIANRSLL